MPNLEPVNAQSQWSEPSLANGLITILLCFVVGLVLSCFAWLHFTNVDKSLLQERLLRGAQTLAAYSSTNPSAEALAKIAAPLRAMQLQVLAGTAINQQFLDSFQVAPDPVTGATLNLRYLPKVRLTRGSKRFEMRDYSGQYQEFPLVITDPAIVGVQPVSDLGEYYPILLQANTAIDNGMNPYGLNHFFDEQFHLVMDQARDSGLITSRIGFPLVTEEEPFIIAHFYIPLYTPGTPPQTITERRERHTGFLSAVSFTPGEGLIEFLPESYLGLEAAIFSHSEAFHADNFDSEFQEIFSTAGFVVEEFTVDGFRTHMVTRPSYSLRESLTTSNRWWALSIGLLLTTWVCSLLWFSRSRSSQLLQLVEKRTHDLAERSDLLSESQGRYRMLAENVSDVIYTHDLNGICTYISPSVTQQSGFAVSDYIGKPIHAYMTAASAKDVRTALAYGPDRCDKSRYSVAERTFESEINCKDGSTKTLESTLSLLLDKAGKPEGYLGVSRDITERKKNEREKAGLEAAFHQSQKMEAIGTLAGGVAHDFNNLLTGILGHAELLKADDSSIQERAHSVETIETAALRAKELTSQLLGFARKGHYQSLPVNINMLLGETLALLKRTLHKNINIKLDICEDQLIVTGDPGQISQVILNLAVNARDAMPNGGDLGFSLALEDLSAGQGPEHLPAGKYCRITVSDTGVGIPKENIDRIFEPFFTDKPKGKGTGLGLAMVYGVTRNHGGAVKVESTPGHGTSFIVYFPLTRFQHQPMTFAQQKRPITGRGNVLFIDDEDIVRDLAEMMLNKLGYQVFLAEDGAKGVLYYKAHVNEIDLVVVDMNMPHMGGLECAHQLTLFNPTVRIILATGYSHDSLKEQLNQPNIVGFLPKPFLLQDLSELLARCIRE